MVVYACRNLTRREQAYDLLARAAREQWGMDTLPALKRTDRGKPFFETDPGRQFNLSHSIPYALCALDDAPVGVDVQKFRRSRPTLLDRVCGSEERDWLRMREDSPEAFALLWSLKESLAKQRGTGLTRPISGLSVPLPEGEETLLQRGGLWFRIYRGENWSAAVCGIVPPPEELIWV